MKINHPLACALGLSLLLGALVAPASAQEAEKKGSSRTSRGGPGGFDPEQMRQRIMERMREQFDVKNDEEWKLIFERIEKVMNARRDSMGGGFGGFPGIGGPRPPGGGERPPGGEPGGERGGERGRGGSPEVEALQKAIEAKASAEEIKTKLAALRESRKQKEAQLEQAQTELRQVLTMRQEATAVLMGLLK